MSVQELLKKQASEFMSLHETLRRMMATDGSSYAEAAQALSYSLQAADEKTRPAWQIQTVITPCSPLEEKSIPEAWQCLNQAASQGVAPILPSVDGGDYENLREFYESWGDILHRGYFIEYGFRREAITQFLGACGMDIASVELPPDEEESPQEVGPNARFDFSSLEEGESTASRLAECAKENARLSRDLQDLQRSAERVKTPEADCGQLRDELKKLAAELADKEHEIDGYKSCEFKAKERTSVLTLLWALATELGVTLDTNRLNNLGKVRTALQQIACNLDDKTIRKYLKEAAEMVEENKIT